jgi:hypothetical protein
VRQVELAPAAVVEAGAADGSPLIKRQSALKEIRSRTARSSAWAGAFRLKATAVSINR